MKILLILAGLLAGTSLYQPSNAQVNVNINIGSQPLWGPTGYDYVDYYYFPDLDIYYYVPLQQWVYSDGVRWITTTVLPPRYSSYDLYQLHKVVINEKQPYLRNTYYRKQYVSFKGRHDQQPIRDSRDPRYFVINNHPMHSKAAGNSPGGNQRPVGNPQGNTGRRQQGNNNRPQVGNSRPGENGNRRGNDQPQGDHRGPR